MKKKKNFKFFREWKKNLEESAEGVGEDRADKYIEAQYRGRRSSALNYGYNERDRLAYGDPAVQLVMLPYYLCKGFYFGAKKIYKFVRK